MKLDQLALKVYIAAMALDDELEAAKKGDEVLVPDIKGLRHEGRKYTLRSKFVAEED